MFYTIYKTTNIVTGKYYIGKHKTKKLFDKYLGSGKRLKYAIKKYGIHNFHKEIILLCESEDHMNIAERILVVPDEETNYNLCNGGYGDWKYANKLATSEQKKIAYQKSKAAMTSTSKNRSIGQRSYKNKTGLFSRTKEQMSDDSNKSKRFLGKKHSYEWKLKHSLNQTGSNNSQYGTCWITNGQENKKIKQKDLDCWLELGYNKGRRIKFEKRRVSGNTS